MTAVRLPLPTFVPVRLAEAPVMRSPRHEQLAGCRLFRGQGGFLVGVAGPVIERMVAFANKAAPNECFGLVVGRVCEDRDGRYVVVLGVVPDPEAKLDEPKSEPESTPEVQTEIKRNPEPEPGEKS